MRYQLRGFGAGPATSLVLLTGLAVEVGVAVGFGLADGEGDDELPGRSGGDEGFGELLGAGPVEVGVADDDGAGVDGEGSATEDSVLLEQPAKSTATNNATTSRLLTPMQAIQGGDGLTVAFLRLLTSSDGLTGAGGPQGPRTSLRGGR